MKYSQSIPFISLLLFALLFSHCSKLVKPVEPQSLRWLEDIPFDSKIDDKTFEVCDKEEKIYQYFNLGDNIEIEGEKYHINQVFKERYDPSIVKKESGLVRIRFVVNCEGETDRFRVLTSSLNYEERTIDENVTNQLLEITKSLKGWKQKKKEGLAMDYYQYLIFRIVDGEIIKILP